MLRSDDQPEHRLMRILLVEDNLRQRELLIQILQPFAAAEPVAEATTQSAAFAFLQAGAAKWDLVLIDLFLAQGNGFAVLKECKRLGILGTVILMSDYNDGAVRQRATEEGADLFLDKAQGMSNLIEFLLRMSLPRCEPL